MATVDELIADAREFVAQMTDDALLEFYNSRLAVMQINPGNGITYTDAVDLPPPDTSTGLSPPTFTPVELELPPDPAPGPEYQSIEPIEPGTAPVFTATPPGFTTPTRPSQLAEFVTPPPGVNTNIDFPEPPPQLINPVLSLPTLTPRGARPVAPEKIVPAFEAVEPVDTSVAPTNLDTTMTLAYNGQAEAMLAKIGGYVDAQLAKMNPQYHAQMAAIEAQLTRYMAGGTGLDPAVEDAIYSRARERNEVEAARIRDAAYEEAAARGFTLPTGALSAAIARARQDAGNNNAKTSADIAVAQAKLEQENLQFAVTTSIGLRSTVISMTLSYMQNLASINGQALEFAKALVSAMVESYNIEAKVFATKLEAYKAAANVYETKLRGVMMLVDIYKAEIQVMEADVSINKMEVDIYKAEMDSLNVLANLYRGQIEAVKGRVDLEKIGIEVYQLQVQAYAASVQSKNAQWQGYSAEIDGEVARIKAFAGQVDAFNAQVSSYKAGIEAKIEQARATATVNDARSRQYSAELGAYEVAVRAKSAAASGNIDLQRQKLLGFEGQIRLAVADAQLYGDYYKHTSDTNRQNASYRWDAKYKSALLLQEYGKTIAQLNQTSATYLAKASSAALSGMNTLTSRNATE